MNSMAIKYLIFKLDFWKKKKNRNKHKNGKEMRVLLTKWRIRQTKYFALVEKQLYCLSRGDFDFS